MRERTIIDIINSENVKAARKTIKHEKAKSGDIKAYDRAYGEDNITPVIAAVKIGYTPMLELLLEEGFDINAQDKYGSTALHYAICSRNDEIIKVLLKHNPDLRIRDMYRMTPLDWALELATHENKFNHDTIKLLLTSGAAIAFIGPLPRNEQPLIPSVMRIIPKHLHIDRTCMTEDENISKYTVLNLLMEKGARLDVSFNGVTALMIACYINDKYIINFSLRDGADINQQDKNGDSAIMYAAYSGYFYPVWQVLQPHHNRIDTDLLNKDGKNLNKILAETAQRNAEINKRIALQEAKEQRFSSSTTQTTAEKDSLAPKEIKTNTPIWEAINPDVITKPASVTKSTENNTKKDNRPLSKLQYMCILNLCERNNMVL